MDSKMQSVFFRPFFYSLTIALTLTIASIFGLHKLNRGIYDFHRDPAWMKVTAYFTGEFWRRVKSTDFYHPFSIWMIKQPTFICLVKIGLVRIQRRSGG